MVRLLTKISRIIVGILIIIIGLILWPLPIPFGAILTFTGLWILSLESPAIKRFLGRIKVKFQTLRTKKTPTKNL